MAQSREVDGDGGLTPRRGPGRVAWWRRISLRVLLLAVVVTAGFGLAGTDAGTRLAAGPAAADQPTRSRMVYDKDHADPEVVRAADGRYYTYGTNRRRSNVRVNVPVMMSTDLATWTEMGDALWSLGSWASFGPLWAPTVSDIGGQYVLFYTASRPTPRQLCLGRAVSPTPTGPFVDRWREPLICPEGEQFEVIDPSLFIDDDGRVFLHYKTSARDASGTGPTIIWTVPLTADGLDLAGEPQILLQASERWEEGGVENPEMVRIDGRYLLFYSGAWWDTDRYTTGVAQCSGPMGPCRNKRQVLASDGEISGPGGASLVQDRAGGWWIVYHAWVGRTRALHVDPIDLSGAMPVIDPSRSTPRAHALVGSLDVVAVDVTAAGAGASVRVAGWAADLDDSLPVRVEVTVDDRVVASVTADDYRGDLRSSVGLAPQHGFDTIVRVDGGTTTSRRVCVTAFDDGSRPVQLGCRAADVKV